MPDSDGKENISPRLPKRDINAELRQIRDQAIKDSAEMNKVVNQEPVVIKDVAQEQLKESATQLAEKEEALVSQIFEYADLFAAGGERIDFHIFEADRDSNTFKIVAKIDSEEMPNMSVEFSKGMHPLGKSFGVNTDIMLGWWHSSPYIPGIEPRPEIKNYVYVDDKGNSAKRPMVLDSQPLKKIPHPMSSGDFQQSNTILKILGRSLDSVLVK